jgi:uncharacterized protein (DUF58 family)
MRQRALETLGITRAGGVLLAVAAAGWVFGRFIGGVTLLLLAYGVVIVVGVARFLGRRRLDLAAKRTELPTRLRQGQRVEVELTVTARRRVGVFVLEEILHPHLGLDRRLPVAGLAGDGVLTHRYAVTPRLRGIYDVGPLRAVWTDPFGLSRRATELLAPTRVIVHPSTEAVHDRPLTRQWEDPPTRPPESKPWPSGFEFYGMRDYVRGDDLRRVVWKAVARTGRMLVRESEQGITDRVVLLLDDDGRFHSPGSPSDTFEAAVKTVASLATHHLKDGFAVAVETNAGSLGPPVRGSTGRIPVLDRLAGVQPTTAPLADAVARLLRSGRADAHTLIVTAHVDEAAGARIRLLVQRGTRVVLVLLAWEGADPRTTTIATSLGCQVVTLRPLASLEATFRAEVGAGR